MEKTIKFERVNRSALKKITGGGAGVMAGTCTAIRCNTSNPIGCNGPGCACIRWSGTAGNCIYSS